jgi:xanthine dehydrogenase large subunit
MKNIELKSHVRGESLFVEDLPTPSETLHGVVFGSPVACGFIQELDCSKALASPGVTAVLTAQDIPGENQVGIILADEPLLAAQGVAYAGQPLALVLAGDIVSARAAAAKIEVRIDAFEPLLDPREAATEGELFHPPRTFRLGDTTKTWEDCAHIFSGSTQTGGQEHLCLETQSALALPGEHGGIRIWSATQSPTVVQSACAKVLGLPMNRVEVDVGRIGGGFGGKESQATPWAVMAALGAFTTQRPVKLVLDRMEDMRLTGKRHPYVSDFKIGLAEDLKILAYEVVFFQNGGAVADLSPAVLERTLFHATNSYYIPNVTAKAHGCRTNLPPNTAFRGFGAPQGMFVIEAAMAYAAEQLGVAAAEIQKLNLLTEGDQFPYGQKAAHCTVRPSWKEVETRFQPRLMLSKIDAFNRAHSHTKRGLAFMPICFGISFTKIHMNQAAALVHVYQDGSVGISTAATEMGQGVNTKLVQVAAVVLGIDPRRVKIETTNTTRVANTSPTAASSAADLNGKAVAKACKKVRRRLLRFAAQKLGHLDSEDVEDIEIREEAVWHKGLQSKLVWEDLVLDAYLARISLSAQAHYATPGLDFDPQTEKGSPFAYHVYGTAVITATLDCLRGTYAIDAVRVVHDFGRSLNPIIDRGQMEGGIVQGIGWLTMEEVDHDEQGRLIANTLSTYKVPDLFSAPVTIETVFMEGEGSPLAIFKSKAIGEPPFLYGIGAYFAIRNAMRAFRPESDLPLIAPLTPERVLLGLYG